MYCPGRSVDGKIMLPYIRQPGLAYHPGRSVFGVSLLRRGGRFGLSLLLLIALSWVASYTILARRGDSLVCRTFGSRRAGPGRKEAGKGGFFLAIKTHLGRFGPQKRAARIR
jgi:hypothetical protein